MTQRRYAAKTTVSSAASREEIERTLARYGAEGFAYGWSGAESQVAFVMNGLRIQLRLPLPERNDRQSDDSRAPTRSPGGTVLNHVIDHVHPLRSVAEETHARPPQAARLSLVWESAEAGTLAEVGLVLRAVDAKPVLPKVRSAPPETGWGASLRVLSS